MIIDTNNASLNTQDKMYGIEQNLNKTMAELSSGLRINTAADDPAGAAIAARMTSAIGGMQEAQHNVNDGISLLQTADSGEQTIGSILQTMNQLAIEASNGTNSTTDRTSLQQEFSALLNEVNHIADTTNFNNIDLLSTTNGVVTFQVSNNYGDVVAATLYNSTASALGISGLNLVNSAQAAISAIASAINSVSVIRAGFGAVENRLNYTLQNLQSQTTNTQSSRSQVEDANMTQEMSKLTKYQILEQSSIAMLQQANQQPQAVLKLLQ